MPAADFPNIEPANVEIITIAPTQISVALSGRETRSQVGSPYMMLTYEFAPLDSDQRRQLSGHIANARGTLQAFNLKLPTSLDDAEGAASGTIQIGGARSAGNLDVTYTKLSTDNETVFKAGDFIQFSNHSKIYEVTADSVSTGSSGTVSFFPPLRTDLTTSHTIGYQNLEALVRYSEDPTYSVNNSLFANFTLTFKEVFE